MSDLICIDPAHAEIKTVPETIDTQLSELLSSYPDLYELIKHIYEQSQMSPSRKAAFNSGVKIAIARGTDKDICSIGISIDDMVLKQLFTGSGGSGRLVVLINNAKRKLAGLTNGGWTPVMTKTHISEAFARAETSEAKGGVPNWDYELSGILQFMRTAYTVASILKVAERMLAAKESKARAVLGLPTEAMLSPAVFMQFPYIDHYTKEEIIAVSTGAIKPEDLSIIGPTASPESAHQIQDSVGGALKKAASSQRF